jgi:hypothetical protein
MRDENFLQFYGQDGFHITASISTLFQRAQCQPQRVHFFAGVTCRFGSFARCEANSSTDGETDNGNA